MEEIFEEIRRSYTSLQMSLFLEYYIKIDYRNHKTLQKVLDSTNFDVSFGNHKYLLRKDYIEGGFQTSTIEGKELNMGIIGEMAMFHSFSYITSSFKELIESEKEFRDFVKGLLQEKLYNYETFYSILCLIRSISIHGSISNTYELKEGDFSKWKEYQLKKGITTLELRLNIIDGLHRLDITIDINKIIAGYKFSEIFDGYKMLMFIELCMNVIASYENSLLKVSA